MTPATLITNYLLLHLSREFPGLDVWRSNVVAARAGSRFVRAGEPGQADLTGVWGGRCRCGKIKDHPMHTSGAEAGGFIPSGRSIWIEVKAPGDKQSPEQKDFERRVSRLGALYIICLVKNSETINALLPKPQPGYARNLPPVHPTEIAAFFSELRARL